MGKSYLNYINVKKVMYTGSLRYLFQLIGHHIIFCKGGDIYYLLLGIISNIGSIYFLVPGIEKELFGPIRFYIIDHALPTANNKFIFLYHFDAIGATFHPLGQLGRFFAGICF